MAIKSRKVTIRLQPEVFNYLSNLEGRTFSEKLARAVMSHAVADSFRDEVKKLSMEMSSHARKLDQIHSAILATNSRDAAAIRAALALILEHSLLPAAPMDRKPGLRQALELLSKDHQK
ncbi:MAG: hypothetical protein DI596_05490 [Azospira oryzae]|nr:MAG: hypothetical protein DI596_05490 [Azospira oryzae]PZP80860.1 MAG: hypothetical protein DI593_05490 [Azospira oryzae]